MKKTLCLILAAIMMFSVFSVTINAADAGAVVSSAKVSGNGIVVKWAPVKGAASYILYRSNSADGSVEAIANITANQYTDKDIKFTSVNDNDATAVIYTYAVAVILEGSNSPSDYSFDGANNSCEAYCECKEMKTVSKPATVYDKGYSYKVCNICKYETKKTYTDKLAPKAPVISKLANIASGVYIKWNLVDGAKEYIIYRKVVKGSWVRIDKTANNSFTDKTAKSGTTYQYAVRASNGKLSSYKASAAIMFLATPDDFKIANSNSAITLTWEKIAGATSYRVYRKVAGDESFEKIGTGTAYKTKNAAGKEITRIKFVDKEAEAGVDYIYTVKSANGKYYSDYVKTSKVNENSIRRLTTPELTKIENSKDGVTIYWSKVEGATGYYVYRKTANGWLRVGTVNNARSTAYLVRDDQANGVLNGKTNTYTVKAVAGKSASAYDKDGIKILRIQQPELDGIKSIKSGVYVSWDSVAGAKGYYVYSKTAGKGWKRVGTANGQSKDSFVDKSAKKGTTYTYTVKAFNGKTVSSYDKTGLTVKDVY